MHHALAGIAIILRSFLHQKEEIDAYRNIGHPGTVASACSWWTKKVNKLKIGTRWLPESLVMIIFYSSKLLLSVWRPMSIAC
jgi:hypothetical protein